MKKLLLFAVVVLGFSVASFAQVSATALASGTIVAPIAISNTGALDFGNVAVSPTVAGTVVMVPAGTRTPTGGVTLPAITGTPTAAHFLVTGTTGYTYAITLPSTPTVVTSGTNTMTINAFTSTPTGTGTLGAAGQTIDVGATLNVAAGQAAGTYTTLAADKFTVTVNYN